MFKKSGAAVDETNGVDLDTPLFSEVKESSVKGLVLEGRKKIESHEGIKDVPMPISQIGSVEVKEFLREKVGNLSIEGTINEMYLTIKNMETQLRQVLDINNILDTDIKTTKEALLSANKENNKLSKKLDKIFDESPLRIEVERELNQLIVEHNKAKEIIQDTKVERCVLIKKIEECSKKETAFDEERRDDQKEILFYQAKLDNTVSTLKDYEGEIDSLNGEILYYREKIKSIEEELSDTIEDRNSIQTELKECKESFDEIYEALVETKIKTKKFFYQELKGE